ncbi:MAG: hypothetical protein M3497_06395 [Gemmatimonadota bacterium]|nr:hypothetical protein [Gemmatimonadota bacterium]
MPNLSDLAREYEARHFPATQRLDLHSEGPDTARVRALRWIQTWAHEAPGTPLLLVVERGVRPGARSGPVRRSVEKLLDSLVGGLIEGWQPFGAGSLAVRIALRPRLVPIGGPVQESGEGRTPETAGTAYVPAEEDIPEELLPLARHVAELRRTREGLAVSLLPVVLRRVWIEAQAEAMLARTPWEAALQGLLREEQRQAYDTE